MEQLIDIALKYAKWGWPVLPLYSPIRGKCDCVRIPLNPLTYSSLIRSRVPFIPLGA